MPTVYVGIGSNIDARAMVTAGVHALQQQFDQLECSPVYRAAAVGFDGDPFLNLVCRFSTDSDVIAVDRKLHDIEDRHGRRRDGPKFSSRTLDIDLLLYGDQCLQQGGLSLPRDEILRYAFVLQPLSDLAPGLIHPQTGTSMAALWREFDANGQTLDMVDLALFPTPPEKQP
jgi:2-amino-4-hydroxy-6-hydroxymethyldihydropteridine diphosphokinase